MPRPRKRSTEAIEDAFFDLSVDQQVETLFMLQKLHRLKKRQKETPELDTEQQSLLTEIKTA